MFPQRGWFNERINLEFDFNSQQILMLSKMKLYCSKCCSKLVVGCLTTINVVSLRIVIPGSHIIRKTSQIFLNTVIVEPSFLGDLLSEYAGGRLLSRSNISVSREQL